MVISAKLLNDGERVVVSTRTHWKALIVPVLVLVVCAVVAGFAATWDTAVLRYLVWAVALVVLVWWSVRPFLRWATSSYTLTSRRLITRQGILTRTGHDIPLNRISDVTYEHGITDRLLGCGTLVIADASNRGQVTLPDVPHVEQTHLKLSNLLFGGQSFGGQGDGPPGRQEVDRRDDGT